jgi:CelD/BcsL family acetyltransferase involved in cellulose biosynthesis
MLRSVAITDRARLEDLAHEWEALLARSASNEVTLHPRWMLAWWDVFGDGREIRTAAFYDGDRLVGLAPLLARRFVYRRAIPFRRLELLASGEDRADEICSDYIGVIAERGREREVADAFAHALVGGAMGGWDELSLRSMNGDTDLPKRLQDAFAEHGMLATLEQHDSASYAPLPKTWDAYTQTLKRKKRWQLRDTLKSFEAWAGHPPEITKVRTRADLDRAKRVLRELHGERWSEDAPSQGVFASRRFTEFHDRMMDFLLERGALDLGWMSARGEPVSAFYNYRWDGRVQHYQSGRKRGLPEDVRVGFVMNACLIRAAIEEGQREYDFLGGPSPYKSALAQEERPIVALRVARRSFVELARRAAERAIDEARRLRVLYAREGGGRDA